MTRRLLRQIHLWVGLGLCLPLVAIGLTGSLLVFGDELNAAASGHRAATEGGAKPIAAVIAAARSAVAPGFVAQSYAAPGTDGLATVRLAAPRGGDAGQRTGEALRVMVDPVSLATYPNPPEGFLRQVFYLHTTLLIRDRTGRQFVGWLGVAMLILGVSGFVNWLPYRAQWRNGQWRRAFIVRRPIGGFALARELHGAAGIWGLAVFMIVSFGGVELAFPDTVSGLVALIMPARDLRSAAASIKVLPRPGDAPMTIDDAVALAYAAVPDTELRLAFLPTRPDQPIRLGLQRPGQDRRAPAIAVVIDPWTRQIVEIFDPRNYSSGETLVVWQHAIHAGQGWGPVWKCLVFLSGFLPLGFAVTGATMWWIKRRRTPAHATDSKTAIDSALARRAGE